MKEQIKKAAVKLANERGLENLSRALVCDRAGVSPGSFTKIMGLSFKAFLRSLADEGHGATGKKVTHRRVDRELRRKHILATAVNLVRKDGAAALTRKGAATAAGVHAKTISWYLNTMPQFRRAVLRQAKQSGATDVVAKLTSSR